MRNMGGHVKVAEWCVAREVRMNGEQQYLTTIGCRGATSTSHILMADYLISPIALACASREQFLRARAPCLTGSSTFLTECVLFISGGDHHSPPSACRGFPSQPQHLVATCPSPFPQLRLLLSHQGHSLASKAHAGRRQTVQTESL